MPYDIAIIGAGSAGLAAYSAAKDHTDSIALIESGRYGTTCALSGCMPSKLLIAAADSAHAARHAEEFGIRVENVEVDDRAVMERLHRLRDDFVSGVVDRVHSIPNEHRYHAAASFRTPHHLRIGDDELEAERFIIATGSSPHRPKLFCELGDHCLTTDEFFELDRLPERVAVIGAGPIGLELGQSLHRLGREVCIYELTDAPGPPMSESMSQRVKDIFTSRLDLELGAQIKTAELKDNVVHLETQKGSRAFDLVLLAAGRIPNLESLKLEAAGLQLDEHGIPEYDPRSMQCSKNHIFIGGDVKGKFPLLHEAAADGRIAGDNAGRFPDIHNHRRTTRLSIFFTDPQVAMVGEAIHAGQLDQLAVGEVEFSNQGRSRVIDKAVGAARVYGNRESGRLAGAEIIGPAAEHLGHMVNWIMKADLTVREATALPYYHPTVEEGLRTALRRLQHELGRGPELPVNCLDCGPGT